MPILSSIPPAIDRRRTMRFNANMRDYPVETRFTAKELKQLDATAKSCGMTRSEVVRARALGKILTTSELADWVETEALRIKAKKARNASRSA